MTREETVERIKVMQAFVDGKQIEYRDSIGEWRKTGSPVWSPDTKYRIKPESMYRSFKDAEECWQEMQKHQPFGWLCNKLNNQYYYITALDDYGIVITPFDEICYTKHIDSMKRKFTFADGTPFGIKD